MTRKKAAQQLLTGPMIRFGFVVLSMVVWVGAIVYKLTVLQVVQRAKWVDKAAQQQQRTFDVAPRRGVLYDRNLRELAMTVLVDSIYAVPSELGDNREEAAQILAKVVHGDPSDNFTSEHQMLARFNASKNFAWVARKVDADTAARVRELGLKGIYLQKEFKRFYPNNDLGAQVLGYVGTDDSGLGGLELKFDDEMHGVPGRKLTAVDAKRHVLDSAESEPLPGENLVLAIDANIQYMAERALDAQMDQVKALHGTVVVQDPHTGQILALAVSPRFNPNDKKHMDASVLQNLAVSDIYEPGSTFKLVTYAAALDGAGVEPTDIVDCKGGAITLFGRTIHDDKSDHFGRVTVQYALEHSSDVGAVQMALKLGPQKFYSYVKGFGFGERSGIELPSETRGLLNPPKRWGATSMDSIAMGQEVGVTPVQLVSMVSAIANGGVYMPPRVLLQSTDAMKGDPRLQPAAFRPANQLPAELPEGAHRVISEMTSAKMRMMMQGIVTEGTGSQAKLNGYSSAGKTGTAQKIDVDTGTYSHTKLVASFAGFAPVSSPAIAIAVVIDNPTQGPSKYGGMVSAPVFAEVAQQVLEYLGVPHDQPLAKKTKNDATPVVKDAGDAPENAGDPQTMFAAVNDLPEDDPLRARLKPDAAAGTGLAEAKPGPETRSNGRATLAKLANLQFASLPEDVLAKFRANGGTSSVMPDVADARAPLKAPVVMPAVRDLGHGAVIVDATRRVAVPSFGGSGLRSVVEQAALAGLKVEPVGSGLAREQVPTAGTMVPIGTAVVVRFMR